MKQIVIIGAGGFGREVAWLIEEINKESPTWDLKGFIDEDPLLEGKVLNGYKVIGGIESIKKENLYACIAIGSPQVKKEIVKKLQGTNIKYANLIHPNVVKSSYITYGQGCIICAGNILTVNIEIGDHVIINLDCTIGHDVRIGSYSTILPSTNISGYDIIGESVTIGTGTKIIQGLSIGENAIIGAGSTVIRDIDSSCTVVGSPARVIK